MAHIYDLEISSSNHDLFLPINNRYILYKDSLFIFRLDEDILNTMKTTLKNKVNSIMLFHIPIESGIHKYYDDLCNLLKYIIFELKNDITKGNLFIINKDDQFDSMARKAVNDCQRKITSNGYELFPVEKNTCFHTDLSNLNFVASDPFDNNQSYYCEAPSYSNNEEKIDMGIGVDCSKEPYKSDGTYYRKLPSTSSSGSSHSGTGSSTLQLPHYERVWMHETYTFNMQGTYACLMGLFTTAVRKGDQSFSITRKMRYDEFHKVT